MEEKIGEGEKKRQYKKEKVRSIGQTIKRSNVIKREGKMKKRERKKIWCKKEKSKCFSQAKT